MDGHDRQHHHVWIGQNLGGLISLDVGDITKRDLVLTVPKMYGGTHLPHPKAELLRGSTVTVRSDTPLPIELDGEQPGTTPVRFEVVPRALRLRVPRGQADALRDGD